MSFATLREMTGRGGGNGYQPQDNIQMGAPPAYKVDREDSLAPRWWDIREWSRKKLILTGAGLIAVIIILVVVIVEETKKNAYPNYTTLNYTLAATYSGTDFFSSNFDYFNTYDPSAGFVHYVDADAAATYNLTYASASTAVVRVDTSVTNETQPNASTGRFSVRLQSKTQYTDGLFLFDVKHTPLGCATWPALWLTDPSNWPANGEIDIMEAVNVVGSTENQMTLHTSSGCTMDVKRKETGSVLETSCVNSTGNDGCGVHGSTGSFGTTFNSGGGGVMAMELRSAGIRMWQFDRNSIPTDAYSGNPNPSAWGEATADFPSTNCNIGNHFKNQSIIVNIDLCGNWAGTTSIYSESCPGTCTDYVANNATAFTDAYWEFGNFTVYQAS